MVMLEGYRVSKTQQLEDLSSGMSGALGATASQVWVENPSSSATRLMELDRAMRSDKERSFSQGGLLAGVGFAGGKPAKDVPDSPIVTKDDADMRVREAGVPLTIGDQGIPEDALNILISRKRDELKRKAIMDSAPGGFWNGAAKIGVGLAVSIADPINVASAFVPIVGQARYAKLVAGASSAAGRASVRAGVGVTEGAVGAALVEPLVLIAAEAEQADYGLYDSFLNLAFGAVLGGGLHSGLGAVGDAIGRSSPQTKETMLKGAIGQAMDDRPIDLGYLAQTDPSFKAEWRAGQFTQARDVAKAGELEAIRAELIPVAGEKRAKGEIKKTRTEVKDLEFKAGQLENEIESISAQKGKRLKKQGIKKQQQLKDINEDLSEIKSRIDNLNDQLKRDEVASKAAADISRIEQGLIPEQFTGRVTKAVDEGAIKVNPGVVKEFNQAFDELRPELVTQAAKLDPATQARVLADLEAGRVPDVFINDVAKTLQGRLVDFEASAPKRNAPSKEASSADSFDAEQRLAEAPADLDVSVVDSSTDDILTALDDLGTDTVSVRAEIDDINQSAEREGNGLREATMCLLGR